MTSSSRPTEQGVPDSSETPAVVTPSGANGPVSPPKPSSARKPAAGRAKPAASAAAAAVTSAPAGQGTSRKPAPRRKSPPEKQRPAGMAAEPDAAAADDDAPEDEEQPKSRFALFVGMPSWLVSTVAHIIILLLLAWWTFSEPEDQPRNVMIGGTAEHSDELEDLMEFELDQIEEMEVQEASLQSDALDPGAIDFGSLPTSTEAAVADTGIASADNSLVGEIGALFGTGGDGLGKRGMGLGGINFFGTASTGNRFVFVIDNSNSMGGGKMETAMHELVKSVKALDSQQSFYVIFFSDTAYGLFYPQTARSFVPATDANKDNLRRWLSTVEMCLKTQCEDAMKLAFALRPDAIYILGDGAFTDKTTPMLTAPHNRSFPIHTLGMNINGKGAEQMKAIAAANKGTFKGVGVHPFAAELAKKNPIPKNNSRGAVWGIALGAKGNKKPGPGGPGGPKKKR